MITDEDFQILQEEGLPADGDYTVNSGVDIAGDQPGLPQVLEVPGEDVELQPSLIIKLGITLLAP